MKSQFRVNGSTSTHQTDLGGSTCRSIQIARQERRLPDLALAWTGFLSPEIAQTFKAELYLLRALFLKHTTALINRCPQCHLQ